jgi:tetratricopeptide (TPR) repeat protein
MRLGGRRFVKHQANLVTNFPCSYALCDVRFLLYYFVPRPAGYSPEFMQFRGCGLHSLCTDVHTGLVTALLTPSPARFISPALFIPCSRTAMAKSTPSDESNQPTHQVAHLSSFEAIAPENASKAIDSDTSHSATTVDSDDKELEEARCAVTQLSSDHPDWLNKSLALTALLSKSFKKTGQETFLSECIDIQRRICAFCTTGNPNRAASLSELALSLRTRFNETGEGSLLSEAITLNREALSLRPIGHPERSMSCMSLASLLWIQFEYTGGEALLSEAIDLDREVLSLRPRGHPDRASSCNNLALSLLSFFDQTGEEYVLAEAIHLNREALSLRPNGHSSRSISCNNLAISLHTLFDQTGVESMLTEAIELHREALSLRPSGHPDRSSSCNNLAFTLYSRFKKAREEHLLVEAIELLREALFLLPHSHPDRSSSYNSLALSLWAYFNQTGEEPFLTEAIVLHREALSLRPSGHPNRSSTCSNLALSLCALFEHTREESMLVEAIHLHREALSVQSNLHPLRLETCSRLVASLRTCFELTGDEALLFEAIDLTKDILEAQPQHHPSRWNAVINLSHIYLNRQFSQRNAVLAIEYMQQALSLVSDDWPGLLSNVAQAIDLIDLPTLPHHSLFQLLQCFSAAIDLASRVAGFVLDLQSQLRYLSSSQNLGPHAYLCALACRQPRLGLELLERARAVIWTQALHMRNPQLSGAPRELRSELEFLLESMQTLRVAKDSMSLSSHDHDVRFKNSDKIHQLIQRIRDLPGQERFMRGLSSTELAQCGSCHVVVVLIATQGECHALILQPDNHEPVTLELSDVAPNELMAISVVVSAAQRRGSAWDGVYGDERGMKAFPFQRSLHSTRSDPVLGKLWTTVVKPVFDYLQFQVCIADGTSGIIRVQLRFDTESLRIITTTSSLVPDRPLHVPSTSCCWHI